GNTRKIIKPNSNYCAVLRAHQTIAVTGNLVPESIQQRLGARLVFIGCGVEGFLKVSNTTLSIGHADSAHAVDSATYAHTRLWRYLAEFFFNPLRAISINFLEAAFIRDKFCAQLPGGTASFELLRVFVDHQ